MAKIKVIKVEPGKKPYVDEIQDTYKAIHEYIGGYIEYVYLDGEADIICDEEGKFKGLTPNRYIHNKNEVLVGKFLIVGDDHLGGERSLTEEEIEKYLKEFDEIPTINPEDVKIRWRVYSW